MRRTPLLAIPVAALAVAFSGGSAVAAPPVPYPEPTGPISLPDVTKDSVNGVCPFPVEILYTNVNQHVKETHLPDGTVIQKVEGRAFINATNQDTGKTKRYNVSGPGTITFSPNGVIDIEAQGLNLFWTPKGVALENQLLLQYSQGPLSIQIRGSDGQTLKNEAHNKTDACAQLA